MLAREGKRETAGERQNIVGGLTISYTHERERERGIWFFSSFFVLFFFIKGVGERIKIIKTKRLKT